VRVNLVGSTTEELVALACECGQPAYRGRQLAGWVYGKSARSFDEMSSLPAALRAALAEGTVHPLWNEVRRSASTDGTTKILAEAADGARVECVFLPYSERSSVCVSTQVGCAMDCAFCATAMGGLSRSLCAGEIVDQVLLVRAALGAAVTHVVYMGMGEPLANYAQTVRSIRLLAEEVGISPRRITVSTVGIPDAIRRLAGEGLPVTLAVSLHAPDDALRRELMPVAGAHSLDSLLRACRDWTQTTRRRMTFEYLLLDGINDSADQARELARRIHGCLANVNIIPYNHVEGRGHFHRPRRAAIEAFKRELERAGIAVTERLRRGNPVSAACGQLRNESVEGRKLEDGC